MSGNTPDALDPVGPSNSPATGGQKNRSTPGDFKQYQTPDSPTSANELSPMDMMQGQMPSAATPANLDSLLAQAGAMQGDFEQIRKHLNTPNLQLKKQHTALLQDKLEDSFDHIRQASQKLGLSPKKLSFQQQSNPIQRFLALVSGGQEELLSAKKKLESLRKSPDKLNPAELLLVQIKLSQAQQSLEYSSIMLSKVVDIFNKMLNIQL